MKKFRELLQTLVTIVLFLIVLGIGWFIVFKTTLGDQLPFVPEIKQATKATPVPLPTVIQPNIPTAPAPLPTRIPTVTYVIKPDGSAPPIQIGPAELPRPTFVSPPKRWTSESIVLGPPVYDEQIVNCSLAVTKPYGQEDFKHLLDVGNIQIPNFVWGIDKRLYLTAIVEPRFYLQANSAQMTAEITYDGNEPRSARLHKIRIPKPQIKFGPGYVQNVYPFSPETWRKDLSGLTETFNANRADIFTIFETEGVIEIGREMENAKPAQLGGKTLRQSCMDKLAQGVTISMFKNIVAAAGGGNTFAQDLLRLDSNAITSDVTYDPIEWIETPWLVRDPSFTPKKPQGW